MAVFTVGLGVLNGHYNEFLAARLREGLCCKVRLVGQVSA